MSFIDLPINNIDEIQEDKPVPEGTYKLVIAQAKEKHDEDGTLKGVLVICEIVGFEDAANVMHNMALPLAGDDPEKLKNKLKFIKRFTQLFKIPVRGNQFNLDDFVGKSAECMLTQDSYNDMVSNKIKLPPIKD